MYNIYTMTKNCSTHIGKQKLLLKVLHCLAKQYFFGKTNNTSTFMANPSEEHYINMKIELDAIVQAINVNPVLDILKTVNGPIPLSRIVATFADGKVAFDSSKHSLNTYANAVSNQISPFDNYGTRKPIQVLNTDEKSIIATQIKPAIYSQSPCELPVWITEASVFERTGCACISNTGFVGLSLEVDIKAFPFETCSVPKCVIKH